MSQKSLYKFIINKGCLKKNVQKNPCTNLLLVKGVSKKSLYEFIIKLKRKGCLTKCLKKVIIKL